MTPDTLTVAAVLAAIKAAEDKRKIITDFRLILQSDGSGFLCDSHDLEEVFRFDNLSELLGFVVAHTGWKTNACQLGLHPQCIYGPSIPCTCDCHKAAKP